MRYAPLRIAGFLLLLLCASARTPAQVPASPLFWFRADSGVVHPGDTVTSWHDLSGHGYDALPADAATRPVYTASGINGRPAVLFPGAHYLRCPDRFPTGSDYTKIVVARIDNYAAANNILSGNGVCAFWLGGTRYPKMFHNGTFVDSYTPVRDGANILECEFTNTTLTGAVYVNGAFGAGGIATVAGTDSALQIGAFAGNYFMAGAVSEILVYNRILTAGERVQVEEYLAVRYGIPLVRSGDGFPFTQFPRPFAFYSRNGNDSAIVPIAGTVSAPGFDSVRVDLYRDGGYWRSVSQPLAYAASGAPFELKPAIYARPVEFGVRVYLTRGSVDSLIGVCDSIICGDALLVCGQSNSTPGNAAATYSSEFCRTFGVNTGFGTMLPSDTVWGLSSANASGFQGRWHVGVWALRLQENILEREGIPTCVITGGVGGSTIEQNARDDSNPENLASIYGRMLYRVRKAGLARSARALFWYQGESNGIANYATNFRKLYSDWRGDYPGLRRFYVMQTHPGCSADPATYGALRELQRTLQDSLPLVTSFASTGMPGHDGCHYSVDGYYTLAGQLYRLLARDFYGSDDTADIESPDIERAWYASSAHDEIILRFQAGQQMTFPNDTVVGDVLRKINEQFFLDDSSGNVANGEAIGNTIHLHLKHPGFATHITYVPSNYYEGTQYVYEGPWIVNRRGVGAFTFNEVPIYASASGVEDIPATDAALAITGIMPNPAAAEASVVVELRHAGEVTMELFDAAGRLCIRQEAGRLEPGMHAIAIDLSGLTVGIYRCVVRSGPGRMSLPIVVVR
ncbi:MAG TPA: sialate O-acetylesterase [Candidatus Kapabacteria bacterium]|nr:sialate O-acetylesterase [Candidatus Kapabacteria bacterium]